MKRFLIACIFTLLLLGIILIITIMCSQPKDVKTNDIILSVTDKPMSVEIAEAAELETVVCVENEYEEFEPQYIYCYNYHDSDYDDMCAKDYIAQRESGQDYEAVNGQYYGKYQLQIDMLGGDLSPENQEATAERYMEERYGSWEEAQEFWDEHGWW